jgi:hypothetical protein
VRGDDALVVWCQHLVQPRLAALEGEGHVPDVCACQR